MSHRPRISVAVVMRRELLNNRWQPWRWFPAEVVPHEEPFGSAPRLLHQDEAEQRWLFPAFDVELFRDDAEGYYLNLSAPEPCWFVHWRMDDEPGPDGEQLARPVDVSLSYHDAGRWLDAQENVDQLPVSAAVRQWLQAFVEAHYQPEPRRRRRPQSFRSLTDRFGNPASVSTGKSRGGGAQGEGGGHG
ncbi:hypothetical protein ALDI51_36280 [Alicycliphilus denitrificans]|uniref:DUF3305 domain-containing protein n=1 Tax=Alicycliphilus denitrificans TaxID=179636 RepID=UPI000963D9A5|nr:DUF3305 domain-containing protein [Alicycliphilus denitrificans]MBN9575520.1 DUF3305 domain-containing protein [Alicycliphilus denitrificans]OJW84801.1 MAG: hypothetical protein BGO66_18760 [Alicycliphilus sp. 69-12]BCN40309.1 hypothetical protein ALDI51_36280 [Alicycliphilus denitrificans]